MCLCSIQFNESAWCPYFPIYIFWSNCTQSFCRKNNKLSSEKDIHSVGLYFRVSVYNSSYWTKQNKIYTQYSGFSAKIKFLWRTVNIYIFLNKWHNLFETAGYIEDMSKPGVKTYDKHHYCLFCNYKSRGTISKHYFSKLHREEPRIQRIRVMPTGIYFYIYITKFRIVCLSVRLCVRPYFNL